MLHNIPATSDSAGQRATPAVPQASSSQRYTRDSVARVPSVRSDPTHCIAPRSSVSHDTQQSPFGIPKIHPGNPPLCRSATTAIACNPRISVKGERPPCSDPPYVYHALACCSLPSSPQKLKKKTPAAQKLVRFHALARNASGNNIYSENLVTSSFTGVVKLHRTVVKTAANVPYPTMQIHYLPIA